MLLFWWLSPFIRVESCFWAVSWKTVFSYQQENLWQNPCFLIIQAFNILFWMVWVLSIASYNTAAFEFDFLVLNFPSRFLGLSTVYLKIYGIEMCGFLWHSYTLNIPNGQQWSQQITEKRYKQLDKETNRGWFKEVLEKSLLLYQQWSHALAGSKDFLVVCGLGISPASCNPEELFSYQAGAWWEVIRNSSLKPTSRTPCVLRMPFRTLTCKYRVSVHTFVENDCIYLDISERRIMLTIVSLAELLTGRSR